MRTLSTAELRLWIAAAFCIALFTLLGHYVSTRTPTWIDVEAVALRGQATGLASFFTALGRWYGLAAITLVAAIGALAMRTSLVPIIALFISQMLSQGVVSALKPVFHRTRPDYWLIYQERDLSYPSGHAVTAVVFFFELLLLTARTSALPRPVSISAIALLSVVVPGIMWSRVALGAHYLTDVVGGVLLGVAWLCVAIALAMRAGVFRVRSGA